MIEVEIKDNKPNLKILIDQFPLIKYMDNETLESLCIDIEARCVNFVKRRRSPKKGT